MGKKKGEKNLREIEKQWESRDFKELHEKAREEICQYIKELDGKYKEKTGYEFLRYMEERLKTPESILCKLERKGLPVDFDTAVERLSDISGVRAICYCVDDIYWIAKQMAREERYLIVKFKDFIMKPKKCGYQSYHIVLLVPVTLENGIDRKSVV